MAARVFLALPLDETIVARLLKARQTLMAAGAKVRWVAPVNLHLTLKFLGRVEDAQMPQVCRLAEEVAAAAGRFEFAVEGLSAVPPAGRQMRMVWCGITEPTGRLAELNGSAEEAFERLGFRAENRRFRPHLTVGRVKSGQNVAELRQAVAGFAETRFGLQPAREVIVFASELTPDGPIYSPLTTAALAAGNSDRHR